MLQSTYFLFFLCYFFNLKFSWGRLEKLETQIPEDSCTRGLGILNLSPEQKGNQKARDAMHRSRGALQ